jgi:hypothetical protein
LVIEVLTSPVDRTISEFIFNVLVSIRTPPVSWRLSISRERRVTDRLELELVIRVIFERVEWNITSS